MKNKKGFTLIELIVIIVLLGVIMVFALPNITSTLERNKKDKMILDAQDMVEKYKNYVLSQGLYSQLDQMLSENLGSDSVYMLFKIFASCSYSNGDVYEIIDSLTDDEEEIVGYLFSEDDKDKNVILTTLSIPLGTLDKREEIIDSPFGQGYKLGKKDYNANLNELGTIKLNEIHSDKNVSYVYMCINDNNTINYKVCLTDGNNTLKADVSELNGDNKYTKISTGNNCNIDQKIK